MKFKKLRAARRLRGLTRSQLADRMYKPKWWIAHLENGLMLPDDHEIIRLAKLLQFHFSDIKKIIQLEFHPKPVLETFHPKLFLDFKTVKYIPDPNNIFGNLA